jgi:hypothetical protein
MGNGIESKLPPKALQYLQTLGALKGESGISFAPDMEAVRQRETDLAAYLGQTDYDKQLQESQSMAKLQLGLALAQRGFGSMGAQPRPGEMAISTVGRELLSPLAGDAMTVAQQMYQQKLAAQQAKRQEGRQLKLAALQAVTGEEADRRSLAKELLPPPTDKGLSTLQANVNVPVTYKNKQGETVTETIPGNVNVYRSKLGDVSQIRTVGDLITSDSTVIASGTVVPGFSKIPTEEEKGQFEALKFVVRRKEDGTGWEFPNAANIVQVRQEKDIDQPIDVKTLEPYALQEGEAMFAFSDLPDDLKGTVSDTGTLQAGEFNLIKPDGTPYTVTKNGKTRTPQYRAYSSGVNAGSFVELGTMDVISANDINKLGLTPRKITADTSGKSDAQIARDDRRNLLYSKIAEIQVGKLPGDFSIYSPRSSFYFDQASYLNKEFPFKYVPPGTNPNDRSRDVTITNETVKNLLTKKVDSVAQGILRSDFGSANQILKSQRIADAVDSILSHPATTVLGALEIEEIGTDPVGNIVGYTPTQAAFDVPTRNENVKDVFTSLKQDPDANAYELFQTVPRPDNEQDLNKTWGSVRVASEVFPDAFGNRDVGRPGTGDFDAGLVQQRMDIEHVLPSTRLVYGAPLADQRALIQEGVQKRVEARNKLQNSRDASEAKESFDLALEFQDALLSFKNAAAESNVQGWFTGTAAKTIAKLGFADWLKGEGEEHWIRLSLASERFQEGISRRVGRDFGDNRISNYDAEAYKKLVADIRSGKEYNRILVEDGLQRVGRDLTDLMAYGGKVGWTERDLSRAAEAGVDFSQLPTQMGWHGYGYYGKNRYGATRQFTPSLTEGQRDALLTSGNLKATMYGHKYNIPLVNNGYTLDQAFAWGADTQVLRKGPLEFEEYLQNRAEAAKISKDEMRKRIVDGILSYNVWRNLQK